MKADDKFDSLLVYNIIRFSFFYKLFSCLTANFGSLSRGKLLSTDAIYCIFVNFRPELHQKSRNKVGSLSLSERLVVFESGTYSATTL